MYILFWLCLSFLHLCLSWKLQKLGWGIQLDYTKPLAPLSFCTSCDVLPVLLNNFLLFVSVFCKIYFWVRFGKSSLVCTSKTPNHSFLDSFISLLHSIQSFSLYFLWLRRWLVIPLSYLECKFQTFLVSVLDKFQISVMRQSLWFITSITMSNLPIFVLIVFKKPSKTLSEQFCLLFHNIWVFQPGGNGERTVLVLL